MDQTEKEKVDELHQAALDVLADLMVYAVGKTPKAEERLNRLTKALFALGIPLK